MHKKPHTASAKRKISEKKTGKQRSKRTREKISKGRMKPVQQLSESGKLIKTYPSIKEAMERTGINASSIVKVCKGLQMTAGGYSWLYSPHN